MTNKSKAYSVYHNMMAAREQIEFIHMRLEQRKLEQRAIKRHQLTLDRRRQPIGFPCRILRAREGVASKINVGGINRGLQNQAVLFEEGGPEWLGIAHRLNDRPLNQTRVYRALDAQKLTQLPLRTEAARFLRKPDVALPPRQRKDPLSQSGPHTQSSPHSPSSARSYDNVQPPQRVRFPTTTR